MDTGDVVAALLQENIAVLHAVRQAATPSGLDLVVIYLEAAYGQADEARMCLRNLPEVTDVTFAAHTQAIMYVLLH